VEIAGVNDLPRARDSRPPAPIDHQVQYRTIHGYRRAFIHAGQGPTLLFIHGIGDCSDTWHELIPQLAQDHTIIAPDLLGHGRSDKPRADYSVAAYANAMRDLLSVLGVDRATVIGHSFGGGVAMQFAYQYPERCERLVLVSTGGVNAEIHPVLRLASAPNADLILPLLQFPGARVAGRCMFKLLELLGTDTGLDADHLLVMFDALPDARTRHAFLRALRSAVDWRGQSITMLDRCYLASSIPTLLVWGARDAVIPSRQARIAHLAMPGSRLEVFERAGHFPHLTDSARFLSVIRDFLATTAPARYGPEEWRDALRRGRPETQT